MSPDVEMMRVIDRENEAIRISRGEVAKYLPIDADWDLEEVTLISIGTPGKWFYRIEWRPRVHYRGDNLGIPVLMSGKAVVGTESR